MLVLKMLRSLPTHHVGSALTASRCKGIGAKTAVKIKTDWDKRSGERCWLPDLLRPGCTFLQLAAKHLGAESVDVSMGITMATA